MEEISIRLIQIGFLIKVFAGIAVGLVYTYYYTDRLTADTFKFFDDSAILFSSLYSNPVHYFKMLTGIGAASAELSPYYDQMNNWYDIFSPFNDNRTMIRFNALIRVFSLGHYFVHVVFICFLSLTGIIATVKVFKQEYPQHALEFYLILLLIPSVLFWGSGLLKDALVYFSFGMVLLTFNALVKSKSPGVLQAVKFVIAMFLLLFTKFQVFVLIIPLLAAWWLVLRLHIKPWLAFTAACAGYFGVLLLPVTSSLTGFDFSGLLAQKQMAFFILAETAKAGSYISIPVLEPNALSIIVNAPAGFFNTLTRPFITDRGPLLTMISSIENTLILIFGIYSLLFFSKKSMEGKIFPWFCLFYTITYFTLIGLITPILGAMVRYKAQALPFLVIMFVIISSSGKKSMVRRLFDKYKI